MASTEDFARHFPISEYGCQPHLNEKPGKDTIFVMNCPAYWGSGKRLKFGFVEVTECGHACNALMLLDVRVNDKSFKGAELAVFLAKPFKSIATFQPFLLNPNAHVLDGGGKEIGMLAPSIQRLWKEGYNCELLYLDPKDSSIHILCPYNNNT